jgi:hypothetical protein
MTKITGAAERLIAEVDAAKAKAKAEGYEAPDGTYTFTSKEASVVTVALGTMGLLLAGDLKGAILSSAMLAQHGDEVKDILTKISKELLDKQCPAYITEAVDRFTAERDRANVERNNTDKNLS